MGGVEFDFVGVRGGLHRVGLMECEPGEDEEGDGARCDEFDNHCDHGRQACGRFKGVCKEM